MGTSAVKAQAINEGFDDVFNLPGWDFVNMSNPLGVTDWFQGSTPFPAHAGAATAYIGANYNNAADPNGVCANWLILPQRTLSNGDTLSFYTRTVANSAYPDRIEIRQSLNGGSIDVGPDEFGVGDYSTLLGSVNPNLIVGGYPNADWAQQNFTLAGIGSPTSGRLAIKYFVTGCGPSGANGNYIGIDTLVYNPVPEPASLAFLGLGALALIRRRR
jgi:hypothetical protein